MELDKQPTLTMFCGLPGSGKSTVARQLESQRHVIRLCTDDEVASRGLDIHDEPIHDAVQKELYQRAMTLLAQGNSVIWEDGNWMRDSRTETRQDAVKRGAQVELHIFDVSVDDLWRRLEKRNDEGRAEAYRITKSDIERNASIFQKPTDEELALYDRVVVH